MDRFSTLYPYLQSWMGEQKFKRYDFRNFELTKALERLLNRLAITMQPLIQDIFSHIIDSLFFIFLKGFVISIVRNCRSKQFQKGVSHVNSFWSEVYKKFQKWF